MTNMKIDGKTSHNSPFIRFPEFTGEWEYFSINDVCSEFKSGKNIKADLISSNGNFPVYGGNGLRGYTSSYNHDGLYVLIGRQGALCGNVRSVFGKIYITEHAIAVAGNEKSDTYFLHYLFLKMNLGQYSDQSAQPGLAVNKLLKLKVLLPSISEQIKIAKLLSLLDERIAVQSRLIEDLKKLRCAIVEKRFKQSKANGRLGDFIEQVSVRNKNGLYSNVLSVSNKQGFVKQSEQFEDRTVASEDTSNYKIVKRNNFAYNPARINVGSIARLTKFDVGIVSPMYVCFRTKASIIPEYMEAFFTSQQFFYEMMKRLEGSVRLCLSYEGLCNIPVYIPDMNKQIAMGQNISLILSKIGLEIEYLGRLHQQKQYLLRKMFI